MESRRWLLAIVVAWSCTASQALVPVRPLSRERDRVASQELSKLEVSDASVKTDCESSRRVFVLKPELERLQAVALNISRVLDIPAASFESDFDCLSEWDHAITVVSFPLHLVGGDDDEQEDYAIAIQPITAADKKRIRKQKPDDMLSSLFVMKPLLIDFCREQSRQGKDLLVQAVSPRKGRGNQQGATIYDLTAGFAQDSLVLARAGASAVTMVERDPVMCLLLDDARRRQQLVATGSRDDAQRAFAGELSNKLHLVHGEAVDVAVRTVERAQSQDDLPDVVYIDPMFPPRTKNASVKKNMQVLHNILKSQAVDTEAREVEESSLLQAAFTLARSRVVCKRPISAPVLGAASGLQPSYDVRGKAFRYDVYVKEQA